MEVFGYPVIQEHHYYPFGMEFEGPWTMHPQKEMAYQYNGKELNEDLELDWLDYGARWYDPAIGRWNAIDPLAEDYQPYSPYCYVINMPVNAIDPDGKEVKITNSGDQEYFLSQLKDVLGSAADLFSFNKNGFLKIDKKGAKELEDGDAKDIVSGFQDIVKDDAIIKFSTKVDKNGEIAWNPEIVVSSGDSEVSKQAFVEEGIVFKLGSEGIFANKDFTDETRGTKGARGLVAMDASTSSKSTFSADDSKQTKPCAGCIMIHEFLDHGRNFIITKYKSSKSKVDYHNKALRIKGSPERNGRDH